MIKTVNLIEDIVNPLFILFTDIRVKDKAELRNSINSDCERLRKLYSEEKPGKFTLTRKMYRAAKTDPTRYRPSSEALLRRLIKGETLPEVNSFVDAVNFLSFKQQICYGLYNSDLIQDYIEIDLGKAGERYKGIRKDTISGWSCSISNCV